MAPSTRRAKAKGKKPEKVEISEEDKHPGVVYVGHVPHGFYEPQMRSFFSQFGDVLSVKLSRSKKTGNSKGYAFIKFRYAAVAKTVAETCHNYLFFNRLLKCSYRPLDELHKDTFKSHPKIPARKEQQQHNSEKSDEKLKKSSKKASAKLKKKMKVLSDAGIDINVDDILSVASSQIESSQAKSKQALPEQKEMLKGKKRSRNDSDEEQIGENASNDNVANDESPEITSPKSKKRKSSTLDASTVKKLGNLTTQPAAKKSKKASETVGVVARGKTVEKILSGKRAVGELKSTKKSKGKVVVPTSVKKPSTNKRKK